MLKLLGKIVVGYLLIGVVVWVVQSWAGEPCNALLQQRHVIGRGNLPLTTIFWLPDLARHAASGDAREYLAPTRCQ